MNSMYSAIPHGRGSVLIHVAEFLGPQIGEPQTQITGSPGFSSHEAGHCPNQGQCLLATSLQLNKVSVGPVMPSLPRVHVAILRLYPCFWTGLAPTQSL